MTVYNVHFRRDDVDLGIKEISIDVDEQMYALLFDVATGRLKVNVPEPVAQAEPVEKKE